MNKWKGEYELKKQLDDIIGSRSVSKIRSISDACLKYTNDYKMVVYDIEMFIKKVAVASHDKITGIMIMNCISKASKAVYGNEKDIFSSRFAIRLTETLSYIDNSKLTDYEKVDLFKVYDEWSRESIFSDLLPRNYEALNVSLTQALPLSTAGNNDNQYYLNHQQAQQQATIPSAPALTSLPPPTRMMPHQDHYNTAPTLTIASLNGAYLPPPPPPPPKSMTSIPPLALAATSMIIPTYPPPPTFPIQSTISNEDTSTNSGSTFKQQPVLRKTKAGADLHISSKKYVKLCPFSHGDKNKDKNKECPYGSTCRYSHLDWSASSSGLLHVKNKLNENVDADAISDNVVKVLTSVHYINRLTSVLNIYDMDSVESRIDDDVDDGVAVVKKGRLNADDVSVYFSPYNVNAFVIKKVDFESKVTNV